MGMLWQPAQSLLSAALLWHPTQLRSEVSR